MQPQDPEANFTFCVFRLLASRDSISAHKRRELFKELDKLAKSPELQDITNRLLKACQLSNWSFEDILSADAKLANYLLSLAEKTDLNTLQEILPDHVLYRYRRLLELRGENHNILPESILTQHPVACGLKSWKDEAAELGFSKWICHDDYMADLATDIDKQQLIARLYKSEFLDNECTMLMEGEPASDGLASVLPLESSREEDSLKFYTSLFVALNGRTAADDRRYEIGLLKSISSDQLKVLLEALKRMPCYSDLFVGMPAADGAKKFFGLDLLGVAIRSGNLEHAQVLLAEARCGARERLGEWNIAKRLIRSALLSDYDSKPNDCHRSMLHLVISQVYSDGAILKAVLQSRPDGRKGLFDASAGTVCCDSSSKLLVNQDEEAAPNGDHKEQRAELDCLLVLIDKLASSDKELLTATAAEQSPDQDQLKQNACWPSFLEMLGRSGWLASDSGGLSKSAYDILSATFGCDVFEEAAGDPPLCKLKSNFNELVSSKEFAYQVIFGKPNQAARNVLAYLQGIGKAHYFSWLLNMVGNLDAMLERIEVAERGGQDCFSLNAGDFLEPAPQFWKILQNKELSKSINLLLDKCYDAFKGRPCINALGGGLLRVTSKIGYDDGANHVKIEDRDIFNELKGELRSEYRAHFDEMVSSQNFLYKFFCDRKTRSPFIVNQLIKYLQAIGKQHVLEISLDHVVMRWLNGAFTNISEHALDIFLNSAWHTTREARLGCAGMHEGRERKEQDDGVVWPCDSNKWLERLAKCGGDKFNERPKCDILLTLCARHPPNGDMLGTLLRNASWKQLAEILRYATLERLVDLIKGCDDRKAILQRLKGRINWLLEDKNAYLLSDGLVAWNDKLQQFGGKVDEVIGQEVACERPLKDWRKYRSNLMDGNHEDLGKQFAELVGANSEDLAVEFDRSRRAIMADLLTKRISCRLVLNWVIRRKDEACARVLLGQIKRLCEVDVCRAERVLKRYRGLVALVAKHVPTLLWEACECFKSVDGDILKRELCGTWYRPDALVLAAQSGLLAQIDLKHFQNVLDYYDEDVLLRSIKQCNCCGCNPLMTFQQHNRHDLSIALLQKLERCDILSKVAELTYKDERGQSVGVGEWILKHYTKQENGEYCAVINECDPLEQSQLKPGM